MPRALLLFSEAFFYGERKVFKGGHVWFPKYELVKQLLDNAPFSEVIFLHWYDEEMEPHCFKIDYSKGYIARTPDHDERVACPYSPMSIVVDCIK